MDRETKREQKVGGREEEREEGRVRAISHAVM